MAKVAVFTVPTARRVMTATEKVETASVPGIERIVPFEPSPVVIIKDWERDSSGTWRCTAKRLWRTNGEYMPRDSAKGFYLYSPCSSDRPTTSVDDRAYAIFTGVWEIIGGSGSADKYGIVMEAVSKPEDISATPPSGMGKVKIIGKEYPTEDAEGNPVDPQYDDCGCLLLAETEQLLNEQVKLIGPFEYDNPDFDPDVEESDADDEPKKKTYYLAVGIGDEYDGVRLQSDLNVSGTSSIKIEKGEEELEFTVHDGVHRMGEMYKVDTPVLVRRRGFKLYVVDGPCKDAE